MISDLCQAVKPIDESDPMGADSANSQRQYKTARRRSLSGSAVPSKTVNRRVNFGRKTDKLKLRQLDNEKVYDSTDTILSELESMDKSIDSLSSSSGINVSDLYRKSNSSVNSTNYYSEPRRKCHSVSAKMKIKHFLAEHIVRSHPCHHPEYHFHRKDHDNSISIYDSKNNNLNESDFQEYSSRASSDTSSSKDVSSPRPKSDQEISLFNNSMYMASNILERIRHINIQSFSPSGKTAEGSPIDHDGENKIKDGESNSSINVELYHDFPCPEPNPYKLPRVTSPCSLAFSTKQILTGKPKRQRLAHSISYDPDYANKNFNNKRLSHAMSMCPEFIPEKDKWEKKISGYLDTSTPTGATLTAINFGLKRVTETDKYLMITKSPTSCPNEFLEEGISHVEATSAIYQSLMRHSTCYDVMPDSGKVIIIDSQMQIGRAFDAIEDNIVRASPIWSSEKQAFIALLTVNDVVPLLLHLCQQHSDADHCCESHSTIDDVTTVTVEKCLSIIPRFRSLQSYMVGVPPETSLHTVSVMLNQFHKTMILVLDSSLSGNPLFLLTSLRTLTYLFYKAHTVSLDSCFPATIGSSTLLVDQRFELLSPLADAESPCQSLCVSTVGKLQHLIYATSSIVDVLRAMASSHYCCALIIDPGSSNDQYNAGKCLIENVITMADILNLIKIQKHRDVTITAAHILRYRNECNESMTYRDPVVSCSISDSIYTLINVIVKEKASFVLIRSTDTVNRYTLGIVTAHDILTYIDNLSVNATELHSNCHLSKLEKCKKNHNKQRENRMRSQSDIYSPIKPRSTILDDSLEEVFDIEFS